MFGILNEHNCKVSPYVETSSRSTSRSTKIKQACFCSRLLGAFMLMIFQIRIVLVAGEAAVKAESTNQCARSIGGKHRPVGVGLHVAPWVEVQRPHHLLAGIGDVRVTAQTVGMHIVEAVHPVAPHTKGRKAEHCHRDCVLGAICLCITIHFNL